ncbi:MAG TPA: M56 family metallopeptidase [Acidobacteriaceae bacterium]|jgi:beta-lactamase regulating signal transducer with metallopeptidase domain|nr:M56 family metallopeptidase [Acidobacteriaceae bacterium]
MVTMAMSGESVGAAMNILIQSARDFADTILAGSSPISQTAGTVLITAIWQGAVIAVCLALCLKLTSRISAALRFTVWAAGFLAVVGLPFLPFLLQSAAPSSAVSGVESTLPAAAPHPWLQLDIRWSLALTLLWASVSLYRLVDLAIHSVRLRSLWKTASPIDSTVDSTNAAPKLWCRKPIQICTTNSLDRPSVIGFFAPRILIPEWLFDRLTLGELEQIALHETEHLRRGDDWTNLLQKLSLVLFPLNPVLLWMERKLCLEREMACDEAVVRVTRAPRAYAACLTSLAERGIQRRAEALSLGTWQRRPELVHRVHSILRRRSVLGPVGARTVVAVLACGIAVGSIELSRCPQLVAFAQPNDAAANMAATEPMPLRMPSRMVDARFIETPQAVSTGTHSNKPQAVNTKATVPSPSQSRPAASHGPCRSVADSPARKAAAQASPRNLAPSVERQIQAELMNSPADAVVNSTQSGPEQSWIVLTTWEEVSSPAQAAVSSTDSTDTSEPATANQPVNKGVHAVPAVQALDKTTVQSSHQLKVTRVIFRVVPASSVSNSPTAVPVRGGWWVIQL